MQKFEFFVSRCTNAVKLKWLQTSVKGDAVSLIKHLSLTDDNYAVAKGKLEKRYNNPESIKHTLFRSLLSFKCETSPKGVEGVLSYLGNAHTKTKHFKRELP